MNANLIDERSQELANAFLAKVQINAPVFLSREEMGDEDRHDYRFCLSQGNQELWFSTQANAEKFGRDNGLWVQNCIR